MRHRHMAVLIRITFLVGVLACVGLIFLNSKKPRHGAGHAVDKGRPVSPLEQSPAFVPAPAGTQAISIKVASGAPSAGFPPGARVDIVEERVRLSGVAAFTKVVVENVMVLSVGGGPSKEIVTVAVTVDERERIVAAAERGPLTVMLRRLGER